MSPKLGSSLQNAMRHAASEVRNHPRVNEAREASSAMKCKFLKDTDSAQGTSTCRDSTDFCKAFDLLGRKYWLSSAVQ